MMSGTKLFATFFASQQLYSYISLYLVPDGVDDSNIDGTTAAVSSGALSSRGFPRSPNLTSGLGLQCLVAITLSTVYSLVMSVSSVQFVFSDHPMMFQAWNLE